LGVKSISCIGKRSLAAAAKAGNSTDEGGHDGD
jgi:hypothetical protein